MKGEGKIRILLVEDQKLLREALARSLGSEPDFEISGHCNNIEEAIAVVISQRVDIVLLDINLGAEQGGAFLSRARALNFQGKILVVTAGIGAREAAWLLNRGCSGIFLKHNGPAELCDRIRSVVRGTEKSNAASKQTGAPQPDPRESLGRRPLTLREREVLRCVCRGLTNKEIAADLGVSENTVKSFIQQLFSKLGARTRARIVALAIEQYWEDLEND